MEPVWPTLRGDRGKKSVVIGVGGATSTGKTTLAKLLVERVAPHHAIHMMQDKFFKAADEVPVDANGELNWEVPEALNFGKFVDEIQAIKSSPEKYCGQCRKTSPQQQQQQQHQESHQNSGHHDQQHCDDQKKQHGPIHFVIIEGFLLYADSRVPAELDIKILIDIGYDLCKKRRSGRSYPLENGEVWRDPPGYFDEKIWPNYIKYHTDLESKVPGLIIVNDSELWEGDEKLADSLNGSAKGNHHGEHVSQQSVTTTSQTSFGFKLADHVLRNIVFSDFP